MEFLPGTLVFCSREVWRLHTSRVQNWDPTLPANRSRVSRKDNRPPVRAPAYGPTAPPRQQRVSAHPRLWPSAPFLCPTGSCILARMQKKAPTATAVTEERDQLLAEIRAARFSNGLRCVHCRSDKVNRHGWFSGRRRYRCRPCKRTFSDLTGTAAAYSKKITLWPVYEACMAEACTVRASAGRTGIATSTSFRWRHAVLGTLPKCERVELTGVVELVDKHFPYSEKGQSKRKTPPERLENVSWLKWLRGRKVNVTVACNEYQKVLARITGGRQARYTEVEEQILPSLRSASLLVSTDRHLGTYARIARQAGVPYRTIRKKRTDKPERQTVQKEGSDEPGEQSVDQVQLYVLRFKGWMHRFHGVATSYFDNYLLWHRQTLGRHPILVAAAMRQAREYPIILAA
jgi:transposase-like protein